MYLYAYILKVNAFLFELISRFNYYINPCNLAKWA
jgi:hypothetical protein